MKNLNQIKDFIDIAEQAQRIVESDADWETKYEIIFSNPVGGRIRDIGIVVDWHDPDTTYEEDVLAYAKALSRKAENLKPVWASLQIEGGDHSL